VSDGRRFGRALEARALDTSPRHLAMPRISRDQIEEALTQADLRRRAAAGDVLAASTLTGIDPLDLYTQALVLAALEGTA